MKKNGDDVGFLTSFLQSFAQAVYDLFVSIVDAVAGVAAFPVLGTINALLALILQAICTITTLISQGTSQLFLFEDFGADQLFRILFPGSENLFLLIRTFAMALLIMVYLHQLVRAMATPVPDYSMDTPFSLTGKTFAAGILITMARPLMRFFSLLFSTAYRAIAAGGQYSADFNDMATTAQELITEGLLPLGIRAQILTCVSTLFLIVMCAAMAKTLIRYLIEVVQRYIVLNLLMITSPLAAILVASNATKKSFQAWLRMVASQMLLMVFSVLFLRVFFHAVHGMESAFAGILAQEASLDKFFVLILWCFLVYGVLHIGTRVDSYLNTLGLSVAECGAGMASSLMSEGMSMIMYQDTMDDLFGAVGGFFSRRKNHAFLSGFGTAAGHSARQYATNVQSGPAAQRRVTAATPEDINRVATGGMETARGKMTGNALRDALRGLPSQIRNSIDPASVSISGGAIYGATLPDVKGQRSQFVMFPVRRENPQQKNREKTAKPGVSELPRREEMPEGGRMAYIGKQPYLVYAEGEMDRELMINNPAMRKYMEKLEEETGKVTLEAKTREGKRSGIWQMHTYHPDGSLTIQEWAPVGWYAVDKSLFPQYEQVGGITYAAYEKHFAAWGRDRMRVDGLSNLSQLPAAMQREFLESKFPSLRDKEISDVSCEEGVYAAEIDGDKVLIFPVNNYGVQSDADVAIEQISGDNGSRYGLIRYGHLKDMDQENGADQQPLDAEYEVLADRKKKEQEEDPAAQGPTVTEVRQGATENVEGEAVEIDAKETRRGLQQTSSKHREPTLREVRQKVLFEREKENFLAEEVSSDRRRARLEAYDAAGTLVGGAWNRRHRGLIHEAISRKNRRKQ